VSAKAPSASAFPRRSCRPTRRSKSLISILYLKGISTGDFEEALVALLGRRTIRCSIKSQSAQPHPA
jgi:hypothetical protein